MLPRPSQRSIFHLGEEGGDDHHRGAGAGEHADSVDATARRHHEGRRDHHGRPQRRKRDAAVDDAAGVGLQILVQQQHRHHTRAPSHSHIVLKQVVLPTAAARHRRGPCGSFLRACSLCLRELSPNKDVYMYRGDQGFCSEECRCQQMLRDEAREHEAMIKKERVRRGLPYHLHHGPRPAAAAAAAAAAIRGSPRRLLAVAY